MRRRVHPHRVCAQLLAVSWLLLSFGTAWAHQRLTRAVPAEGSTLDTVPTELRLAFSGRVDPSLTRIDLKGPNGAAVSLGSVVLAPDSANVVVVPVTGDLTAGEYTVSWRTVGPDGHPVQGTFGFVIAEGAVGLAPSPAAEQASMDSAVGLAPGTASSQVGVADPGPPLGRAPFGASSPVYVAVRWFTFVCLIGLVGTVAFRHLVLRGMARLDAASVDSLIVPAADRASTIGLAIAIVLVPAGALRLLAQGYALAGEAPDAGTLVALIRGMPWGAGWLLQAGATVVAVLAFWLARRRETVGWALATAAALALAVTPALSGHASAADGRAIVAVAADTLHVLGAGGWLGTLALVVAAGLPTALSLGPGSRGRAVALLIESFSPVALACAGALVSTGIYATWLHLGAVDALWHTDYGRALLVKIALLVVVFGLGAYNFLALRPRVGEETDARRLRHTAALELAFGIAVLVVTAILVATQPGGTVQG